ncbi:MAG: hypothetical protein JWM80_2691 [Cyanobacteria bacterium RYN_339]|nr:hypothetical protein [Cyanobacteria bacterium RYN_339]
MIRPASSYVPYAYQAPPMRPPYQAQDIPPPVPLPPAYPPPGQVFPPQDKTGEVVSGTAIHSTIAAGVGALIGLAVGGPIGAAWGAAIGTGLAQGFMQFLVRMADGSGANGPQVALLTGAAGLGVAALAGGIWGAAAFAWGAVLAPAAIAGVLTMKK